MFLPGRRILRFEVAAEGSDRVTGIVRNLEDFSIPERLSRVCWDDDRVMAIFRGEAREIETKAHDPSPVISDLQHEKELKSDSDSR